MDKMIFKINNNMLNMEAVLVDYNGLPVFYVCVDEEHNRYFVLCIDLENYVYYVAKTSVSLILSLLSGTQSIKRAFLESDEFWEISEGETVDDDIVKKISRNALADELLPKKNAFYEIYNNLIKNYYKKLIGEISCSDDWEKMPVQHSSEEIYFIPISNATYRYSKSFSLWEGIEETTKMTMEKNNKKFDYDFSNFSIIYQNESFVSSMNFDSVCMRGTENVGCHLVA